MKIMVALIVSFLTGVGIASCVRDSRVLDRWLATSQGEIRPYAGAGGGRFTPPISKP